MATFEVAVDRGAGAVASHGRSPAAAAWRRLVASPAARVGLVMVVAFVLVAFLTPLLHVYDARTDANLAVRLKPPTAAHPFGTDSLGRDILVRVLHATRVSLGLAMSAVALATLIGSALGFLGGYLRGRVDLVVMFCMDIVLAFPATLLAIAIVAMIGPGLRNSLFAISLVSIPAYARLSRSSVLALREQEFVMAAQGLGCSGWRVLLSHIVPNSLPPLIVQTASAGWSQSKLRPVPLEEMEQRASYCAGGWSTMPHWRTAARSGSMSSRPSRSTRRARAETRGGAGRAHQIHHSPSAGRSRGAATAISRRAR